MKKIVQAWTGISLVQRIVAGLVIGALLGMFVPSEGGIAILGDVFVGALKAIAPLLSIFLSYQFSVLRRKKPRRCHHVPLLLCICSVPSWQLSIAVYCKQCHFPVTLTLVEAASDLAAPQGIAEVLSTLLMNIVTNPVRVP